MRSRPSALAVVVLVLLAITFVFLMIGLNVAIAYFFVYKVSVHLGATRFQAFVVALAYYVLSGISSSFALSRTRK